MSRLSTMSPEAVKALFSPDSDDTLIILLTIYDPANPTNVVARLADNFTKRVLEDDSHVYYGVTSRTNDFIFIPMEISLPSEEDNTAPRASIVIHDVTRHITPLIRTLTGPPRIKMELVLYSNPDSLEAYFDYFYINTINYTNDSVSLEIGMTDYQSEPFPCYTFTPSYFPGLF